VTPGVSEVAPEGVILKFVNPDGVTPDGVTPDGVIPRDMSRSHEPCLLQDLTDRPVHFLSLECVCVQKGGRLISYYGVCD